MNGTAHGGAVALGVVAGVAALAAGLFFALYLAERTDLAELDGRLAATERGIADQRERLDELESTSDGVADRRAELESAVADRRACADPARASIVALRADDQAGLDAAVELMITHCGRWRS